MQLTKGPRKFFVIAHILFSAIMVGNMATFLILSIIVVTSSDIGLIKSCYTVMNILSHTSIRASTIGATVTGIILAVFTHYGLFQYWWIMVKEALTIMLIGINILGMYTWTLAALHSDSLSTLANTKLYLWAGIFIQIMALVFMFIISKYKPWGKRKRRSN